MELVRWQVRWAWVDALAFQRPVWTVGSDPLNSLQVQGRRREGRRRECTEIESHHHHLHLGSIMALSYIFIHLNISLKLLQTLFPLKCLEVMSSSPLLSSPQDNWFNLVNSSIDIRQLKERGFVHICLAKWNKENIYRSSLNSCFVFAKTFKLFG